MAAGSSGEPLPKWNEPKECPVCHRWLVNLTRHACTATRTLKCDKCNYTTPRFDMLKNHYPRKHGGARIPRNTPSSKYVLVVPPPSDDEAESDDENSAQGGEGDDTEEDE